MRSSWRIVARPTVQMSQRPQQQGSPQPGATCDKRQGTASFLNVCGRFDTRSLSPVMRLTASPDTKAEANSPRLQLVNLPACQTSDSVHWASYFRKKLAAKMRRRNPPIHGLTQLNTCSMQDAATPSLVEARHLGLGITFWTLPPASASAPPRARRPSRRAFHFIWT